MKIFMTHIEPLELKIMATAILGSIVSPFDLLTKFLVPILSGIAWVFLKPHIVEFRDTFNQKAKRFLSIWKKK